MDVFQSFLGIFTIYLINYQASTEQDIYVYPEVYEERQEGSEKLLVIHTGYSLNLKKASVLADTVLLREEREGGITDTYVNGALYERHLYKDVANQASLIVTPRSEGIYEVVGLLNDTHRIEPLAYSERSAAGRIQHRISKVIVEDGIYALANEAGDQFEERASTLEKGSQPPPENFTIDLYFISDLKHTEKFKDNTKHIEYVTLFVLSVSLHLQQLSPPGSIVIKTIHGTYTRDLKYMKVMRDGRLLAEDTLKLLANQTWNSDTVRRSDAVYLATGRDATYYHNGVLSSAVLGLAYVKGACNPRLKFAVGEDKGGPFSGVHTAVHEFGHLLGAHHDGVNQSIIACRQQNGYIMSPIAGGTRNYLFSLCSKLAFREFLGSSSSNCLKDGKSQKGIAFLPYDNIAKNISLINATKYCQQYFPYSNASYDWDPTADVCSFRCKIAEKNGNSWHAELWAPNKVQCDATLKKRKCRSGFCWPPKNSEKIN